MTITLEDLIEPYNLTLRRNTQDNIERGDWVNQIFNDDNKLLIATSIDDAEYLTNALWYLIAHNLIGNKG